MAHPESCKKCKAIFLNALREKWGEVIEQWKPGWPCRIEDIAALPEIDKKTRATLRNIYLSLQQHRGHKKFVGWKYLPACDYFVPSLNCIIEFDESQHFTTPRALTLSNYTNNINIGFDKDEWNARCEELNRHDNDPPQRDETRAWYDALRDILPVRFGMNSAIRVYSKHMIWCEETQMLRSFIKSLASI